MKARKLIGMGIPLFILNNIAVAVWLLSILKRRNLFFKRTCDFLVVAAVCLLESRVS